MDPECRSRLRQYFAFSFGSRAGVKICEKTDPDPESLYILGSNRSLRGYVLSESIGNFRLN